MAKKTVLREDFGFPFRVTVFRSVWIRMGGISLSNLPPSCASAYASKSKRWRLRVWRSTSWETSYREHRHFQTLDRKVIPFRARETNCLALILSCAEDDKEDWGEFAAMVAAPLRTVVDEARNAINEMETAHSVLGDVLKSLK